MQAIFSLDRARRAHQLDGADPRRERHRQGADRPRHPLRRARAPTRRFLSINCGAMPENLLESELFGHERGAFTGAVREKKGLFQEADRGTLFLDEIGEMTPPMQVKLLRALQEKVVRRSAAPRRSRSTCASSPPPTRTWRRGSPRGEFREDLYYRINVIPIHLPPLRERREDIPLLVDFFLQKYSRQMELPPRQISVEAMQPAGELRLAGQRARAREPDRARARALARARRITTRDLPVHLLTRRRTQLGPDPAARGGARPRGLPRRHPRPAHAAGAGAHRRRADPGRRAAGDELPLVPLLREEGRAQGGVGWRVLNCRRTD